MTPIRVLLVYAAGGDNATLSYQMAWPRHFLEHRSFQCTPLNLHDRDVVSRMQRALAMKMWRGNAVVMLHSVFSNTRVLDGHIYDAIANLSRPKALFIGNEYKFMPEKMRFAKDLGVSLFVTQTANAAVHQVYRDALGCSVVGIPNTGLDAALFRPEVPGEARPIDLGYRAIESSWYLGHQERRDIADYFQANASRLGVTVDISLDTGDRFAEREWAGFLNRCKGQLGTEAGGDYFEITDATRIAVNEYLGAHPNATFADVHSRFFADRPASIPMRILSGRNIEAAGTGTVQLLFEGHYDGYFQPDVHYIPLKKDFSNVDGALRKFRDREISGAMADNARQLVMSELTYDRLIDRFSEALSPQL